MYFKLSKLNLASLFLLFSAIIISFSFSSNKKYTVTPRLINSYITSFNDAVIALDKTAGDFRFGRIGVDSLRRTVTNTRLSYKKAEFFLAFYHPEYINEHINGAPLLHIERANTQPLVLPPEGLQVLDEMVFAESINNEQKAEIAALAKKLRSNYNMLYTALNTKVQANNNVIAAMRLQLVRIFTLGVTGFDTPGSVNALQEAQVSIKSMRDVYTEIYGNNSSKQTSALFDNAITFLNQPVTFENFDRLLFLKNYIDPLYKQLGELQTNTDSDYIKNTMAWNSKSTSVFSDNFLNPYYFTNITKEEDSNNLRTLGKDLFYDPLLSNDNTISCASCHNPDKAFTDGAAKSLSSVKGKTVLRNAPTLLNAVYADRYFYDLRAFTLEQQAEHVIFNTDEFNTAYTAILKKLETDKNYSKKFKKVFGKNAVNRENFSKALASYVLSLKSFNSSFDKYVRGETNTIPDDVKNGFNLFMGKANCATCHFAPTFSGLVPPAYTDNESEILGVLENPNAKIPKHDTDEGRWSSPVLSERAWIYEKSFKTNTVRNAALTAPYFHNGAYQTLEEVIEFYNKGGGTGHGLKITNQTLPPDELNLTQKEQKDLIAFIKSLSDTSAAKQ